MEKPRGTRAVDDGWIVSMEFEAMSYPVVSTVARCGRMESGDSSFIWNWLGTFMVVILPRSVGFHKICLPESLPGVTLYSKFSVALIWKEKVGKVTWMLPFLP